MELTWFTAMSMDAKLATADKSLDFLKTIEKESEESGAFTQFYEKVDSIIVSAGTLRWLVGGGYGWPHGEKPTWVVTHDAALVASVGKTEAPLKRVEGDLRPMLDDMRASGAKRVWVSGGGELAGQLLALDAIDVVDVTLAPIALGTGPSLFGTRPLEPREFQIEKCERTGNAVNVVWRRVRSAT